MWSPPHPHDCWCFCCLPSFAVALWVFGGNPHKWAVTTLGWRKCAKGYLGAPRFGKNLEVQLRKGQVLWPCLLLAARMSLHPVMADLLKQGSTALCPRLYRNEKRGLEPAFHCAGSSSVPKHAFRKGASVLGRPKKWPLSTTSVSVRFPLLPRLEALCSSHWNCLWGTVHQPNPLAPTTQYLFPPHFLSVELWPAQGEQWWSCC